MTEKGKRNRALQKKSSDTITRISNREKKAQNRIKMINRYLLYYYSNWRICVNSM